MKLVGLNNRGSNCVEVVLGDKAVLFSYETVVGIAKGNELFVTEEKYSNTTSKHIKAWLRHHASEGIKVSQNELERMVNS